MRPFVVAFLAGAVSLGLELVLVRLLAFFLTSTADFLAIPLALLGLALGSMYAHFGWRGTPERLVSVASALVLPVLALSSIALFAVFDLFYFRVHVFLASALRDSGRLAVYTAILLPPFAVFGALFAGLFSANGDRLGRLYAADLAGAAFGCVLAPVLLTVSGLPLALLGVLLFALLLALVEPRPAWVYGLHGLVFAALLAGVGTGHLFREHPDPQRLAWAVVPHDRELPPVRELSVRWNAIARTALMRVGPDPVPPSSIAPRSLFVVQDNGLSNVTLQAYPPPTGQTMGYHSLPWRLGRAPRHILVMFAGAGRDMMNFDALSEGQADIVGVELNPAVESLARSVPELGLDAFLARPNVRLVLQEGRDFLDHDRGVYDLVYVANNGAVQASRLGHTRKFLDTTEAMAQYLDHLAPGGLMMFGKQPIAEKLTSFTRLFRERGLGDFAQRAFVFGPRDIPELQSLVVAPAGFAPADLPVLARYAAHEAGDVLYRPGDGPRALAALASRRLVTDDRPFPRSLELRRLLRPPSGEEADLAWVGTFVKVFTVALFAVLVAAASAIVLRVGPRRVVEHGDPASGRVPAVWVAYLLLTGVGYMCAEIGLIARTELFVGNPLYAVAVNLAVFLLASALGSFLSDRRPAGWGPLPLLGATLVATAWGLLATGLLTTYALSLPLSLKVVGVALAVGPTGAGLGTFYPLLVERMIGEGRAAAIPATYALTTLSSVLGSAFAMTAIIEVGFVRIIALGAACYVVAAALAALRPVGARA